MGFFDSIKQKVATVADEYKVACEWAQGQSMEAVAEAMKEAQGMTLNGYRAVFRERCEDMKTRELKDLCDEVTGRNKPGIRINLSLKTNHAKEIIEDVLRHRGIEP